MHYIFFLIPFILCNIKGYTQNTPRLPKIMVIPFVKQGEDMRTVLDKDMYSRQAIVKVKEGFDRNGYTTVDFLGKLKAVKDNQLFSSENQSDFKSKMIETSGTDIYVEVEVNTFKESSGSSASVTISAYDTSTGNSVSNTLCNSGKFQTTDIAHLVSRAVEKCIDNFIGVMSEKFTTMSKEGKSVLVEFSFAENSEHDMTMEVGNEKLPLSDALEQWFSENSSDGNYHVQGTHKLKMIFDDVKIPLKDKNQNNYTTNKFALDIFKFLKSLGLETVKEIKTNTIYITIK